MKVNRGYRFLLRPTEAQATLMEQHAGVCRLVYNIALEQRRDHSRQFKRATGKNISFASQCAELTKLRAEFDWVRAVTNTAQQQALRDLDTAFRNFFNGTSRYPQFRKKGVNESFRFVGRQVAIRRLNQSWGIARLPKIGFVRFRWTRDVAGTLKNATISLDSLGWHISFATEQEVEVRWRHGIPIGIDRGVSQALALSDGTFSAFPKQTMQLLDRKMRKASRILSRSRIVSNRRKAAKRRVAALKAKAARIRTHFNHVQSCRIARDYGIVVIEALKTRAMTASAAGTIEQPGKNVAQKRGLNRSILEMGWYQFETFLTYKLAANGGELRKVNPAYTSQTCSCCGFIEKSNRKSQAVYECSSCGFTGHADTNAALNILRAGTQPAWRDQIADPLKRESHLEVA